jgi:hypothetical protein
MRPNDIESPTAGLGGQAVLTINHPPTRQADLKRSIIAPAGELLPFRRSKRGQSGSRWVLVSRSGHPHIGS